MQKLVGEDNKGHKYELYYLEDLNRIFVFKDNDKAPRYFIYVEKKGGGISLWCNCPGHVYHQKECRHMEFSQEFNFNKTLNPINFESQAMDEYIRNWYTNNKEKRENENGKRKQEK